MAIVAYVIPFNSGSVSQTQAQPSLYERLRERLDNIQGSVNERLQELGGKYSDIPRAQERISDAQEIEDARDRVNGALGGDNANIQSNQNQNEEEETETESLSVAGDDESEKPYLLILL